MDHSIPLIDIGPLFGAPGPAQKPVRPGDHAGRGLFGFHGGAGVSARSTVGRTARADLLRLFQLPETETRKLWRQKFDPAHPNVYRGWFPLQPGFRTAKEGIDMGGRRRPRRRSGVQRRSSTRGHSPAPAEALPGWRESVSAYYRAMEKVSQALMRAIARGLSLEERYFDQAFDRGLSTLRLLRYPVRTDAEQTAQSDPHVW